MVLLHWHITILGDVLDELVRLYMRRPQFADYIATSNICRGYPTCCIFLLPVRDAQTAAYSIPPHNGPCLERLAKGVAESDEAKDRDKTEDDGHGFAEADGARDGGAPEDHRGQQRQLDAVGLTVLQAVATEAI